MNRFYHLPGYPIKSNLVLIQMFRDISLTKDSMVYFIFTYQNLKSQLIQNSGIE